MGVEVREAAAWRGRGKRRGPLPGGENEDGVACSFIFDAEEELSQRKGPPFRLPR
jgi:hypothetical protein